MKDLRVQLVLPSDRDPEKGCKQETERITILPLKGHRDSPVENGLEGDGVKASGVLSQRAGGLLS